MTPETPEEYEAQRQRKRDRRDAAWLAFCAGVMGGAVGVMLTVAIAVALR